MTETEKEGYRRIILEAEAVIEAIDRGEHKDPRVATATLTFKTIPIKRQCYYCEGKGHKIGMQCTHCWTCNVCDGIGYLVEQIEVVDTERLHWEFPQSAIQNDCAEAALKMDIDQASERKEREQRYVESSRIS